MIALDTNVLVYARRAETPHHLAARRLLRRLAEGRRPWALAWPCVYEYLRVVTHPKVFHPPSDLGRVIADLESLLASPSLVLLGEGPQHSAAMRDAIAEGQATGNLLHHAHIAVLLREHGVKKIWTSDRGFSRFPGLRVRNPFAGATTLR